MRHTEYDKITEAVERAFAFIDSLIDQGRSRHEALDRAASHFGVARFKLAALFNDRDSGRIGDTGTTSVSVFSTPTAAAGTATDTVVPDTFPEEWTK